MSVCQVCNGEMTDEISCRYEPIIIDDRAYEPIRWGNERKSKKWTTPDTCRDCGTPIGGIHHPGCCVERCPACFGQALGCPCFADPEDDEDEWESLTVPERACRPGRRTARCTAHLFPRHYRT
jgi:hypothetical protein